MIDVINKNLDNFINQNASISTIDPDQDDDTTMINYDELNSMIRSILVTRARDGATIEEIKYDYYNLIGENFPINDNITDFILSIPNVTCYVNENGCRIFNITSIEKCQHIIDMVKNQKPPRFINFHSEQQDEKKEEKQQQQKQDEEKFQYNADNNEEENLKSKIINSRITKTVTNGINRSEYNNNTNYYNRNFINEKKQEKFPQQNGILSLNNNNNINHNIKNYSVQSFNKNLYDNNLQMPKRLIKPRNSNYYYNHNQQYKYQNQHKQQYNNLYLTTNQQQRHRLPRRSTPLNENYDYEMDINDIADYMSQNNNNDNDKLCFYEDNYKYLFNKFAGSTETLSVKPTVSSTLSFNSHHESELMRNFNNPFRNNINYNNNNMYDGNFKIKQQQQKQKFCDIAHIHDYQLVGDDFFLSLAKAELGCKLKKGNLRQQSGLCISGQTIQEATFRILNEERLHKKIIINIGSVDILQEHHLIDIQQDFLQLIFAFEKRNIIPIVTTLAPLANSAHKPDIKRNLEYFNEFIRKSGLPYIDIWTTMVNQYGNTYYDCYQSGAKYVSGSIYPHVFWNNVGRQRILNKIKSELAFI